MPAVRGELDFLRSQHGHHFVRAGAVESGAAEMDAVAGLVPQQQVGRAEEGGDETRGRAGVQLAGRTHFEQAPEVHHADAVGEREALLPGRA